MYMLTDMVVCMYVCKNLSLHISRYAALEYGYRVRRKTDMNENRQQKRKRKNRKDMMKKEINVSHHQEGDETVIQPDMNDSIDMIDGIAFEKEQPVAHDRHTIFDLTGVSDEDETDIVENDESIKSRRHNVNDGVLSTDRQTDISGEKESKRNLKIGTKEGKMTGKKEIDSKKDGDQKGRIETNITIAENEIKSVMSGATDAIGVFHILRKVGV